MTHRGLYGKYRVERTDGASAPGKRHYGCRYFVLDVTHDKYAANALRQYAHDCREEDAVLASDLLMLAERYDPSGPFWRESAVVGLVLAGSIVFAFGATIGAIVALAAL